MSPVERDTHATEVALTEEFRTAIEDARDRIAAALVPACPTTAFLSALREEVSRAIGAPESVPYPELADADAYWEATVKPQAKSLRAAVAAIVQWLEERIITTMEVAEIDLKAMVDAAAQDPGLDPGAVRAELATAIDGRCRALHHQMAEVLGVLPDRSPVDHARLAAAEAMRGQATADVDSLKAAYLRDAGGDEDHQRFAEQQWSETFADRVLHREALLAGQPPWRHIEFALVGYERALDEVERVVEETVVRLQAPLGSMQSLLLDRFDQSLQTA